MAAGGGGRVGAGGVVGGEGGGATGGGRGLGDGQERVGRRGRLRPGRGVRRIN